MNISVLLFFNKNRGFLGEALKSYKHQDFKGKHELVIQHKDQGVSANINEGVLKCKGEWIKFLGEDDLMLPNCLTYLWEGRNDFDILTANAINFYPDGTEIIIRSTLPKCLNDIVLTYGIHGGGTMYKKQVLIDNPFDETLWTCEEWELNCRLFQKGYKFGYIDKTVYKYRIHDEMKSGQNGASSEFRLKRMLVKEEIKAKFL